MGHHLAEGLQFKQISTPLCSLARAQSLRFSAVTYLIDLQRVGGHLRAKDPCSYLGKGNVTGRRAIIREWRKSAIVSGPELFNRDVLCRLQDAISYEFG